MHRTEILWVLVLGLWCRCSFAREFEGSRENSILLNGPWKFAIGDGNEEAQTAAGQRKLSWREVKLPGPFMRWSQEAANETKFAWARRTLDVTPAQAKAMAVLRWNRIGSGAAAFLNGRKVGDEPRFSRVFPGEGFKRYLLGGLDPQWLIRWNGLPGTVAFGALEGAVMDRAEKILWAREPKTTVMAAVPAASGEGRVVFSQLDLQGRLDPSKPEYDPVAERILMLLLDPSRRPGTG